MGRRAVRKRRREGGDNETGCDQGKGDGWEEKRGIDLIGIRTSPGG